MQHDSAHERQPTAWLLQHSVSAEKENGCELDSER